MRIVSVRHGCYPEILPLNRNFKSGDRFLKVVLEVQKKDIKRLRDFGETYKRLTRLFPSMRRHNCRHHSLHGEKVKTKRGIPIKEADTYANIAHLMEHVIIDLVANIGGLGSVSGVTCGYLKPISRHDIFVQCPRKELGVFAVNLAVEVMEDLRNRSRQKNRVKKLTKLAKIIERDHKRRFTPEEVANYMGFSTQEARSLLCDYRRLCEAKRN